MIILLILGTLLPMFHTLIETKITMEKRYHAHRVANYVLGKRLISEVPASGKATYNGESYSWSGDNQRMCVSYEHFQKDEQICFEAAR